MRRRVLIGIVALLILLAASAALVLRGDWLREAIRRRILAEIERSTGGAASIGSFSFDWRRLRAEARDLALRGTEPPVAEPLLRVRELAVDLKIVSFWKQQVDLASLVVREPAIHLIVHPDGSTNLPRPKLKEPTRNLAETLLDLAIGAFSIEKGLLVASGERMPFEARGENLVARFSFDPAGLQYRGEISVKHWRAGPVSLDLDAGLRMQKNRLEVSGLKLAMGKSRLEGSGALEDFAEPKARLEFRGHLNVPEVAALVKFGALRQGTAEIAGLARWDRSAGPSATASVTAGDLALRQGRLEIRGARVTSKVEADSRRIRFHSLEGEALGGRFTGRADVDNNFTRYRLEGELSQWNTARVLEAAGVRSAPWTGLASGSVQLQGDLRSRDVQADARLAIAPAPGSPPLEGALNLRYGRAQGSLELTRGYLATPATRLEFSGSVSSQLRVHAESKDLDDLLPALSLVSSEPVESLPVRLQGGSAVFDGVVAGTMPAPSISGDLTLTRFEAEDRRFDRLTAGIELSSSSLRVFHAQLTQGRARIRFEGSVGLEDWKAPPSGAISAKATLNDLDLAQWNPNLRGTLTASAEVMGTISEPRAAGTASVKNAVAFEQPLDRLEAQLAYAGKILEIRQARLHIGTVQIEAGGDLDRDGRIRFRASGAEMPIESLQLVQRHSPTARGRLQLDVTGAGQYQDRHFLLSALDGAGTLRGLTVDGKTVGDATLSTATRGPQLNFELRSNFLNAALEGDGQWRLEPGYAAQGSLRFSKVSLAAVRNWLAPAGNGTFRLEGSAAGIATLRGPAFEPSQWTASLELSELELIPRVEGQQQIKVRNEGPVTATIERGVAKIQTARLTGPSTQLDASGTIALDPAQPDPLDLRVSGGINLAILKDLQPDLIVSGGAALHVTIRGSFSQPLVNGRAELRNAAFNVADIATGLAQANGTILFSGSRATIESFTAETGGGKVQATGFLGFEAGLPSLRLQVGVSQVRIRYPEGVSTVVDAALTLAGTTRSSLLSGQVTVLRSGFAPHSDFSSLLSRSADPVRTPSSRTGPLGGLQFDVRVQSAPNISLESSLARDIQAEANLRLRGTPYNPLLLGNISITQGEITFFGTRYTVSQGSISFLNPVKLEPVLNLDVETRVRGIDVILTLSGPINKLNVTHRADPPLEFSEVVALLATGRTPASDPAVAALQASQPQSLTSLGAGDILGQAIANPVSSRLQRFFGVSKLKIDPKLTGIETNPQARLTLEQQVTKNLTFTYITDLTRSNQQIVRVEWNLNKEWSAVAIREENGLFGLDFLYKKSFK